VLILLLTGCVGNVNSIQIQSNTNENIEKAEKVLVNDDRLRSASVIFHNNDLLSGITVGTFSRFHKQKIEKEIKKKLEKAYPEADIMVSADSKIVMETRKISKIKDEKELSEKIKKLLSLVEEET